MTAPVPPGTNFTAFNVAPLPSIPAEPWPKSVAIGVLGSPFPVHFWIPSQAAADMICPHQDMVLHPRDAARLDGVACPWCGRTLRAPGGSS